MTLQEFYISSEYQNVAGVCLGIKDFLKKKNLTDDLCARIEICLNEALNNVIKHAYRERPGNDIHIHAVHQPDLIEIEIRDNGLPRVTFKKPALDFDPSDIQNLPESGMGLFIISQIMDEIVYSNENGVNVFRMKKKLIQA
ncbi:MAG: ATP-binding protein [bacterium]